MPAEELEEVKRLHRQHGDALSLSGFITQAIRWGCVAIGEDPRKVAVKPKMGRPSEAA